MDFFRAASAGGGAICSAVRRRSARSPRKPLSLLRSLKFKDISLNSVLGIEAPTTHELPCLQGYDPVLALTKLVVAPGENRNRHKLIAANAEETLNKQEFEKLANDEDHKPANDVACRRQVSRNRLNRFKQNDRHDEQRQSRIWAKRHNPRSQAFEYPAIRHPAKDRFEESEKDGVHQEVDGSDQKHKGFEYAAQARFSNEPKLESSLSSRAKAANDTTATNDQNALSRRNFRLHCRRLVRTVRICLRGRSWAVGRLPEEQPA